MTAALPESWLCPTCGNGLADTCPRPTASCRIDREYVQVRLEQAGTTLLALRTPSPYPASPTCHMPPIIHQAIEAYGWIPAEVRPPVPDARAISSMDATFQWLALVPNSRYVIRRIVAARTLVSPVTGRHIVSWRGLGLMLRCSHEAARFWHAQGIGWIVEGLRR